MASLFGAQICTGVYSFYTGDTILLCKNLWGGQGYQRGLRVGLTMANINDDTTQERPVPHEVRRQNAPTSRAVRVIKEEAVAYSTAGPSSWSPIQRGERSRLQNNDRQGEMQTIQQQLEHLQKTVDRLSSLVEAQFVPNATETKTQVPSQLDVRSRMLEAEGGTYTAQEIARLLNVSRATVYNWHNQGDIVGVSYRDRKRQFPAWQFQRDGLLPGLSKVLHILEEDGVWTQIGFMLNANSWLDGETPLDLLRRGDVEPVLNAASMYGEHASI